ncbi:unnamed protein product [Miscanthus lutarioriparius]|uniref:F-box domain-containing protein n=1 Tax=Miscanthus lutarioriparius TaxID=422564 RepID=A0A811S0R2_9POAL|nr:unnamed protein product [Miscanthus lutarioriparius]
MDDLPEALLAEIVKWLTSPSDLKSLSLVSKRLYAVEGELRNSMYIGCGVFPVTVALIRLCFRYPNLCKVEFNYSGWTSNHGMQLDKHGLQVFSSCCTSLTDLTLSFCTNVDDSGLRLLACFKKLMSLRLNTLPAITSSGLLQVAIGCKNLSSLHLIGCNKVGGAMWLEYLGRFRPLKELVVNRCEMISQFDLLKFSPGWMKLQKFEFQIKGCPNIFDPRDPSCVEHCQYRFDFSCESLVDLTLARVSTEKEIGLRNLLRKCKALKNLCLYYVLGVQDNDIVTLSNNCSNFTSISLRLTPEFNEGHVFRTSLTDDSLKALALRCSKLQSFELIFWGCDEIWPEIGFTQEGLVMLIQSCRIRNLVLSGAHIFDDEGMKAISSAQFLESLELMDCINVTNSGMRLLAHCPCLINLTLRQCDRFSDAGVTEVARARKLETLVIEGCSWVSPEAVQGAATSVHYTKYYPGLFNLGRA